MWKTILNAGKALVVSRATGKASGPKIAAVVTAGAALVGAALIASGVSPELSLAVERFVEALGLLAATE